VMTSNSSRPAARLGYLQERTSGSRSGVPYLNLKICFEYTNTFQYVRPRELTGHCNGIAKLHFWEKKKRFPRFTFDTILDAGTLEDYELKKGTQ